MKTIKFVALFVMLISAGAFVAVQAQEHPTNSEHPKSSEHPGKTEHPSGGNDIIAVASGAKGLETFVAAVQAAGLEENFQGKGPYTVFAPTDEAFAKLPAGTVEDLLKPANKSKLAGLLANHVVPGMIMSKDMKTMKATNVGGHDLEIKVSDDKITLDNASVVQADLVASNGVIHAIDTVLIPASPAEHPASDKPKDHPAH